ncbi:MAG: response regulator transcription factor [Actinomycetota bacterium]|nr:response regulator transcription factor [Actinomycetota bacterium]
MTVLLVEDEDRIASFIRRGLEAEGYRVMTASDGESGLTMGSSPSVDLIVLDLMLPAMSGEDVLVGLRSRRPDVPIIVLTAKHTVPDRVANLNAGADDYVTKPFSFSELLARVRARLRPRSQADATTLVVGDVTLDLLSRRATIDGREASLTTREFTLLDAFMRHAGQVLSETQLLDLVWGYDFDPESNVVEVYVGYLRKKLRPDVIETIRGAGYRFRG